VQDGEVRVPSAPVGPCVLSGVVGFEGSGVDFSARELGGLSTFGESTLAGTFFMEETELMSQGILLLGMCIRGSLVTR
jgi:hypothetical protein